MFRFTMNAANSRGDKPVHQVIGEHPATGSVEELYDYVQEHDVLLVQEYYTHDHRDGTGNRTLEKRGPILINWAHVVKADEYRHNRPLRE